MSLTERLKDYLNVIPDGFRYEKPNELIQLLDESLTQITELKADNKRLDDFISGSSEVRATL